MNLNLNITETLLGWTEKCRGCKTKEFTVPGRFFAKGSWQLLCSRQIRDTTIVKNSHMIALIVIDALWGKTKVMLNRIMFVNVGFFGYPELPKNYKEFFYCHFWMYSVKCIKLIEYLVRLPRCNSAQDASTYWQSLCAFNSSCYVNENSVHAFPTHNICLSIQTALTLTSVRRVASRVDASHTDACC